MTVPEEDIVLKFFVDDTLVLMLALVTALVVGTTTLDEVVAGVETEAQDVVDFEDVTAASAVDIVHFE